MLPRFKVRTTTNVRAPNGAVTRKRYSRISTNFISSVEGNRDKILDRICRHNKRGAELSHAPDGVYTWIMYTAGDGFEVYAGKIRSKQELGTLHQNLHLCVQKTIQFAGELRKTGATIEYNLQSGTYMARKFTRFQRLLTVGTKTGKALEEAETTNEERIQKNRVIHEDNVRLRDLIRGQVDLTFRSIGLDPIFLEAALGADPQLVYGGLPLVSSLNLVLEEGGSTNRSLNEVYSE
jgi:hypothetical protein